MLKARILSCADRGPGGAGEAEGEGTLLTFGCVWVVFWRFGACVEFSPVVGVAGVSGLLTIGGGGEAGDFPESSVFASGGYSAGVGARVPAKVPIREGDRLVGQDQAHLTRFNAVKRRVAVLESVWPGGRLVITRRFK